MHRFRFLWVALIVVSPALCPAGARAQLPYGRDNPVLYVNDQPDDVYVDGYIMALAANGEIRLRGMISSGVDCNCGAGDNYPKTNTPAKRTAWIAAARDSGFRNIPDNTNGTQAPKLQRPSSGVIEQTKPIGSPGTSLIVAEARAATPERPLVIVVAGPITTVADAYLTDNAIADRVIVAWLAGTRGDLVLNDWNAGGDTWASEIVMRKLRVVVFPTQLGEPYVPESRMMAELPDKPLRKKLIDSGYYKPNYDADGQPAVSLMAAGYVTKALKVSIRSGVTLKEDPAGDDLIVTATNNDAGSQEWWRAVKKAFAGGGPAPAEPDAAARPDVAARPDAGADGNAADARAVDAATSTADGRAPTEPDVAAATDAAVATMRDVGAAPQTPPAGRRDAGAAPTPVDEPDDPGGPTTGTKTGGCSAGGAGAGGGAWLALAALLFARRRQRPGFGGVSGASNEKTPFARIFRL